MSILYEDSFCKLEEGKLTIKWYYFPAGSSKVIDLKDIHTISLYRGLSGRIWGSGDMHHWLASDSARLGTMTPPKGTIFIELMEQYWIPGFSCDHARKLIDLILTQNKHIVRKDKVRNGLSIVDATTNHDE